MTDRPDATVSQSSKHWQDVVLGAAQGTRTGALVRAALGRNKPTNYPRFLGRPTVTSDGFMVCNFADALGQGQNVRAFAGHIDEFAQNVRALADHCSLTGAERSGLFTAIVLWIGTDYSGGAWKTMLFKGGKS